MPEDVAFEHEVLEQLFCVAWQRLIGFSDGTAFRTGETKSFVTIVLGDGSRKPFFTD
jgi:hypothetical protein